jgi:hypothetical protein
MFLHEQQAEKQKEEHLELEQQWRENYGAFLELFEEQVVKLAEEPGCQA